MRVASSELPVGSSSAVASEAGPLFTAFPEQAAASSDVANTSEHAISSRLLAFEESAAEPNLTRAFMRRGPY